MNRLVKVLMILMCLPLVSIAQHAKNDSLKYSYLKEIKLTGIKTLRGTGHMPEVKDGIIYAGKKNEVILIDSLDANKAINNTRQILGRIPGLNIVETETGGFTANGIATRGLNPSQSIEMNTRQNGYNISADVFGYNEAYYVPPMEAVSRIETLRGAASLQFGSQFGGMINYVINKAPADKRFQLYTSQTIGSYGLYNNFSSVGGTVRKWNYYSFVQYRNLNGWRPNSNQSQFSGFGKLQYDVSKKFIISLEYSLLRNKIKMPGGLTDSMFSANPRTSFRSRNWLQSPWNIIAGIVNYIISPNTYINLKASYLFSRRSLVWRNEEGGAGAIDQIDPSTSEYVNREVENEMMHNTTTELRLLHNYKIGKLKNTFAGGVRYSFASFKRQGGGKGTKGSNFDLSIDGKYEYDLHFSTNNLAPFVENIFRIGLFSITPGFRLEYLKSTSEGYKQVNGVDMFTKENRSRLIPLFGIGTEYKTGVFTNVYANISKAYRPIDYAQITPFGTTSQIDPQLKDASGYNFDLSYRGTLKNFISFDFGLFYLQYNKRIGLILMNAGSSNEFTFRTNVANSVHKGLESYAEFNILKLLNPLSSRGLSIFNSMAIIDAKYTSGKYKGNRVEVSTNYINRCGINYFDKKFSATFQLNNVGDAYGDATNSKITIDPAAGYIPSYAIMDFSASYHFDRYALKTGVSNLTNKRYFTRRTDEYPGPGIIPSDGRSFYAGVSVKID